MNHLPAAMVVSSIVSAIFTGAVVMAQSFAPTPLNAQKTEVQTKQKKPGGPIDTPPAKAIEARPVFVGKARAVGIQRVESLTQQNVHQGRPALRAELIFVREVCHLDQEHFRKIAQDGEVVLKKVATELAKAQQQGRIGTDPRGAASPAPRNLIGPLFLQDELAAVMKKNLTADQFVAYQAEVDKREAQRKQAAVRYLVSAIDHDLYLSDDQRVKVTEALLSHWDDRWSMTIDYLLYGNQFYPQGIDALVWPYLSAAQTKVWRVTQRVSALGGVFGVWGGFLNDNDALEQELGEPRGKPDEKKIETLPRKATGKAVRKD